MNKKIVLGLFTFLIAGFVLFSTAGLEPVLAANNAIKDALGNGAANTGDLVKDFKSIITIVMTIGILWVVLCIVIGAMLLSGSVGNPQRRTAGIIAVLCAAGGAWIIYKAYDIASWATNIG